MSIWNVNYRMGIPRFDQEHQELFRISEQILNQIRSCGDESGRNKQLAEEWLCNLHHHFRGHVLSEEIYMAENGYEGLHLHRKLHDDFYKTQQLQYQTITEHGKYTKEEIWDFVGAGVGWLIEHIANVDMAIVGKNIAPRRGRWNVTRQEMEEKINLLFVSVLNTDLHARIIDTNYKGEDLGKTIYQKMEYKVENQEVTVITGVEKGLVLAVGRQLYGKDADDEMDLVLSTFNTFGMHFWQSLSRHFLGTDAQLEIKEGHILLGKSFPVEFLRLKPALSILFATDVGSFFVASSYAGIFLP